MQHAKLGHDDPRLTDLLVQAAAWEYDDGQVGLDLHVGDIGWELRQAEPGVHGWWQGDLLAAVALVEGALVRPRLAPALAADPDVVSSIVADVTRLVPAGEAWCDAFGETALRTELTGRGWEPDPQPWGAFSTPLAGPLVTDGDLVLARDAVEERVAVQRNGFDRSTFTVERWEQMSASPIYDPALDLLLRDEEGRAVAAGTAWSAGPGRPGILEPVATHRDHRGLGHGKRLVRGLLAALAEAGASSATVCTPQSNLAGSALYVSAGMPQILVGGGLWRRT